MNTIVLPSSWWSRMTSFCMSRRISGSSAENGSSNSSSVGVAGQRAGQADALLHAAGELVGVVVLVAREADQVDHLLGALRGARPCPRRGPRGRRRRCRCTWRCGSRPKCWNTIDDLVAAQRRAAGLGRRR